MLSCYLFIFNLLWIIQIQITGGLISAMINLVDVLAVLVTALSAFWTWVSVWTAAAVWFRSEIWNFWKWFLIFDLGQVRIQKTVSTRSWHVSGADRLAWKPWKVIDFGILLSHNTCEFKVSFTKWNTTCKIFVWYKSFPFGRECSNVLIDSHTWKEYYWVYMCNLKRFNPTLKRLIT